MAAVARASVRHQLCFIPAQPLRTHTHTLSLAHTRTLSVSLTLSVAVPLLHPLAVAAVARAFVTASASSLPEPLALSHTRRPHGDDCASSTDVPTTARRRQQGPKQWTLWRRTVFRRETTRLRTGGSTLPSVLTETSSGTSRCTSRWAPATMVAAPSRTRHGIELVEETCTASSTTRAPDTRTTLRLGNASLSCGRPSPPGALASRGRRWESVRRARLCQRGSRTVRSRTRRAGQALGTSRQIRLGTCPSRARSRAR